MRKIFSHRAFFLTAGILILVGFFVLVSASMGLLNRGQSFYNIIFQQFLFGLAGGTILFMITCRIDHRFYKQFALPIFLFCFFVTLLVFIPGLGFSHGGAKRWINLGFTIFQPSEILKLGFLIYLSAWISSRKSEIGSLKFGLIPFLVIMSFVGLLLVLQPDVGTLGVVTLTSLFLFFLGGGRGGQIALLVLLGIGALGILVWLEPYRIDRLTTFLKPSVDVTGIGYQLNQSLIALGSGGIFGRGFGMSIQKFNYLPEPIGDSIFAVFGEEFGFIGSFVLIGLFLFFAYKGLRLANAAPNDFSRLLGAGIVILIVLGSFINIASMTGIFPLTGIPLIFVSKGGTASAMALAELGILFNISKKS